MQPADAPARAPAEPSAQYTDAVPGLAHFVFTFAVSLLLWVLLAGSLDRQELLAGAVVALLVTLQAA